MGSDRYMEQQMAYPQQLADANREIARLRGVVVDLESKVSRLDSMLRKLDKMPGTNIDLKDAVRAKLGRQHGMTLAAAKAAQGSLPFAKGSETSEEAAESMAPLAAEIRERVFKYIKDCGPWGSTCDMAEQALGLTHQTCSARFNELRNRKRIVDSGATRLTRSGRKAVVYTVKS